MTCELDEINQRVAALDVEIKHLAMSGEDIPHLMEIPGVSPNDELRGNGNRVLAASGVILHSAGNNPK